MKRIIIGVVISTLVCAAISGARSTNSPDSPPEPVIQIDDVERFYKVYNTASGHPTADQLQHDYIDPGSGGLHHLAKVRSVSGAALAKNLAEHPDIYSDAKRCMVALPRVRQRLEAAIQELGRLYPEARFPPVTIVVGRGRPVAIGGPTDGIQIGLEALCATNWLNPNVEDRFVHVIAHEYTHVQQSPALTDDEHPTVLELSLIEGTAEFTAELISGEPGYSNFKASTAGREKEIETAFVPDEDKTDLSNWFQNSTREKPGDLGYWVGYRIVKSYYQHAADKRQAFREILQMTDPKAFLVKSGWYPGIGLGFAPLDKQPTMLSREAFAKASAFINGTARPLERTLFAFHFAHGSRDAVIAELAKFQNSDGGFASNLESDSRWPGSSPNGTRIGLRMLAEVNAPATDAHVQAAVRYLLANFDYKKGYWHALPKQANSAPHAPWWDVKAETRKCEVESPVFPTASIAGYLWAYSALLPQGFLDRITKSSLDYLAAAPDRMAMSDVEMLTELVRFLPQDQAAEAVRKLRKVLAAVVARNPEQWKNYNVQPLTFIHSPASPYYAGMESEVAGDLGYVIGIQHADGGWALTWSWEKVDPAAWETAKKEWRGVVTLENLENLQAFHRIAH